MANDKFKVQVAARIASQSHQYYRRAGLVLTREQQEVEVDLEQLAALRADPDVVVVGGPEILPKPPPAKPGTAEAKLQMTGEARDAAVTRARQLELENQQLKARLSKLEHEAEEAEADRKGK